MVACRQAWSWRRSWEQRRSYILICRQQEVNWTRHSLSIGDFKARPHTSSKKGYTSSNKATPLNSATPCELMGPITFKWPQWDTGEWAETFVWCMYMSIDVRVILLRECRSSCGISCHMVLMKKRHTRQLRRILSPSFSKRSAFFLNTSNCISFY